MLLRTFHTIYIFFTLNSPFCENFCLFFIELIAGLSFRQKVENRVILTYYVDVLVSYNESTSPKVLFRIKGVCVSVTITEHADFTVLTSYPSNPTTILALLLSPSLVASNHYLNKSNLAVGVYKCLVFRENVGGSSTTSRQQRRDSRDSRVCLTRCRKIQPPQILR